MKRRAPRFERIPITARSEGLWDGFALTRKVLLAGFIESVATLDQHKLQENLASDVLRTRQHLAPVAAITS